MVSGMWSGLDDLARRFPSVAGDSGAIRDLALGSSAPRTNDRYLGVFRQFVDMCKSYGIPKSEYFPASPAVVALFVRQLHTLGRKPATIRVALSSITWVHVISGHANPCDDVTLRMVTGGAMRAGAGPVRHAMPLAADDLQDALTYLVATGTLKDLRLAAMMSMSFGAFLRISELLALTWQDVSVPPGPPERVEVFVARRKNDQEAHGTTRRIPAGMGDQTGMAPLLRAYAGALGRQWPQPNADPLWPQLPETGRPARLRPMGWRTANDELRRVLTTIGLPADEYSWHSHRAGAATSAADRGVPEPVMMAAGGWRSASAARTYVHYSNTTLTAASATALARGARASGQ